MKKNVFIKIVFVAVILAAFVGYTLYSKWEDNHFKVDAKTFNVKDNFQGVMNAEYARIPDLQLEDRFGLTRNPNLTVSAPSVHRQVKINKICILPYEMYILYSINLKKTDKTPSDVPKVSFSDIVFHFASGKTWTGKAIPSSLTKKDHGKVFGHRLYRGVVFAPNFSNSDLSNQSGQSFERLKAITLNHAILIGKKKKIPLQHLAVKTDYNPQDLNLFSMPLHKKLTLSNGLTLTFKKLDASLNYTKLMVSLQPKDQQIQLINAIMVTNNKDAHPSFETLKGKNGAHTMMFSPLADVPKKLKVSIQGINKVSKKSINLQAPGWNPSGNIGPGKGKEIFGTTFSFGGYEQASDPSKIYLKLNWQIKNITNGRSLIFQPTLYSEFKHRMAFADSALQKQMVKSSFADVVKITNNRGKLPPHDKINIINSTGKTNSVYIELPKEYARNAKQLHIEISDIPMSEKIKPASISINMPDNGVKGK